jgi:hypothetical protein
MARSPSLGGGRRRRGDPTPPVLAALVLLAVALWAGSAFGTPATASEREARVARLRTALAVKQRHAARLLELPDVVGTGAGIDADGALVIRVLTARAGVRGLPSQLEGVPVRVRVSGRIYALRGATCESSGDAICQSNERWPLPVPLGVSIGHPSITAGTIGVRVTNGAQVFALSNNHVLAASNQAAIGDAALQPGPFDGGSLAAGDAIGTLHDFEPIAFCPFHPICPVSNFFDAAIARSTPAELGFATPLGEFGSAPGYGAPSPVLHPAFGDPVVPGDEDLSQLQQLPVQKYGRTTGLTHGVIDTIGLTVAVCYDELCNLVARFDDQVAISGPFSAGGDSGSLIVTDDALRQPVALLFAGSDTQTIGSRIDLVLGRFGVTVDDGGSSGPVVDAALASLTPPSFALVNVTTSVPVVVRNAGTEPLPSFDVTLTDETESTSALRTAPPLAPGATAQLHFDWTPALLGAHSLTATLELTDDDASNDAKSAVVPVLLEPPGLSLRRWSGTVRTDAWTLVPLDLDYGPDMVVVCTPLYDIAALGPMVARVRNASGASFEVGLGRPWFGAFPGDDGSAEVHCLVVRAGVYAKAGLRMEAVRIDGFAPKDGGGSWVGQARSYAQAYTQPVVLGQVISSGGSAEPGAIGVWSTFWARGATALDPPSAAQLFVGRHTGEDPGPRSPESLAYLVIEARQGTMDGTPYVAGLGTASVAGVDDAPPYVYALPPFLDTATAAAASSAGMNGSEGGWPILYGAAAVGPAQLRLAIEEDWYWDSERSHPAEQVAYLVLGTRAPPRSCGLGGELALLLPLLARLRRLRRRRSGAAR